MFDGPTVFAQLMDHVPRRTFNTCVRRYGGHRRLRDFSCRDQFLAMAFAQLTARRSLRDVETCLRAVSDKLYHAGFRGRVSRSTLADANAHRDWRIYRDLALALIAQARQLYACDAVLDHVNQTVYALDATVIELCLTLFPWAHSQRDKAGVKLHTLLDLRGKIPCFLQVSSTKSRDCAILDELPLEPGAFYVMDRDYNDFARLHRLHRHGAFFIIRGKDNLVLHRRHAQAIDKSTGLRADQVVALKDRRTRRKYPDRLRRISYRNPETGRRLRFLTNHFDLPALTVTQLYRERWSIELFFKWVKQHLNIEHFMGQTLNAMLTQFWIATATYVLAAILKRRLKIDQSMYEILQILSMTLFEKTPINAVFQRDPPRHTEDPECKQLQLFDF